MPDPKTPKRQSTFWKIQGELDVRSRRILGVLSFAVPLLLWAILSYVPWVWHPLVEVRGPGDVACFPPGLRVERAGFDRAIALEVSRGQKPASGTPANPVFLPAPHQVAVALVTSFTTAPRLKE